MVNNIFLRKLIRIAGVFIILVATLGLGILIPQVDKKISTLKNELDDLEYKREVRIFQNNQDYLHYTLKDKVIRQTHMLADAANLSETDKGKLYDEYLEARRQGLGKLYIMHTGEIASPELSASWKKMSYLELQDEINKVLKNSNLKELLDNIKKETKELNNLEKQKSNIIIWITVIQVIGLLLINIAEFLKE